MCFNSEVAEASDNDVPSDSKTSLPGPPSEPQPDPEPVASQAAWPEPKPKFKPYPTQPLVLVDSRAYRPPLLNVIGTDTAESKPKDGESQPTNSKLKPEAGESGAESQPTGLEFNIDNHFNKHWTTGAVKSNECQYV